MIKHIIFLVSLTLMSSVTQAERPPSLVENVENFAKDSRNIVRKAEKNSKNYEQEIDNIVKDSKKWYQKLSEQLSIIIQEAKEKYSDLTN